MHDSLQERTAALARLATMIRTGLEEAESTIPPLNEQLDALAELGLNAFQIEGPNVYSRPAGVSSAQDDSFVVYQAALVMPGGLGAVVWDATEYHDHVSRPRGEPVDLTPHFVPYQQCPTIVRALLAPHAGRLADSLMRNVRLLGS